MYVLALIEVMTLSGHLSNIDENTTNFCKLGITQFQKL